MSRWGMKRRGISLRQPCRTRRSWIMLLLLWRPMACSWAALPRDAPMDRGNRRLRHSTLVQQHHLHALPMRGQGFSSATPSSTAGFQPCGIWPSVPPNQMVGARRQFPSVLYESHHQTLRFQSAMDAVSNRICVALHTGLIDFSENSDYRANYFGIGSCNLHSLTASSRATGIRHAVAQPLHAGRRGLSNSRAPPILGEASISRLSTLVD